MILAELLDNLLLDIEASIQGETSNKEYGFIFWILKESKEPEQTFKLI